MKGSDLFVICDIETEKLDNPEHIWVAVCREVDSNDVHIFREDAIKAGHLARYLARASSIIGHNIISFDLPNLSRFTRIPNFRDRCLDTLVVSRLLNQSIQGGHSLEAWGTRLGFPKDTYSDFSKWSQELEYRCVQDTAINLALYKRFKPYIFSERWKKSLRTEHDIAFICSDMSINGFAFDKPKAITLLNEITDKLTVLDKELLDTFKPKPVAIQEITPKATSKGTLSKVNFKWLDSQDLTPYSAGASFTRIEWEPFNANSPKQIVERLNAAGWQPYEKTKGYLLAEREIARCEDPQRYKELEDKLAHYKVYGWQCSEANLETLSEDAPEASRKLKDRLILESRRRTLTEWLSALREAPNGLQRVHGKFNSIGTWTHRMSHTNPNQANIPSEIGSDGKPTPYGKQMRSLWIAPENRLLIGVDADAIQLRVLAHYMNDKTFTNALISGKKENGTDAHTMNKNALGSVCKSREVAKRFIYAWVLGAAAPKIAQILNCSVSEAKEAMSNFLETYPGLKELKENQIKKDARLGYFVGLDNRFVLCESEHKMLAGYLQNGESVIMKMANILWSKILKERKIPYLQVNFVHDEWQTEVENNMELAMEVSKIQADSLRIVGEQLGLRCPMAGSILNSHGQIAIGNNWSYTH